VAVKLGVTEDGSDRIQNYVKEHTQHSYYITEFAFYETLGVFKKKLDQQKIDRKRYDAAVSTLITHLSEGFQIDTDFRLDNWKVLDDVGKLGKRHSLDYSDALQIYTIQHGMWRDRQAEYKTIFVTADKKLAKALKHEKLRVWNLLKEKNPPDSNVSG
jgi:predicted nucleic acid-binding protein